MSSSGSSRMSGNRPAMNSAMGVRNGSSATARLAFRPNVGVEALASLATVQSGVRHLPQQRTGPVLAVAEVLVHHLDCAQDGIDTDEVGRLQRADRVPEAGAEDLIDGGRVRDAL